jgi:hypothetical protein
MQPGSAVGPLQRATIVSTALRNEIITALPSINQLQVGNTYSQTFFLHRGSAAPSSDASGTWIEQIEMDIFVARADRLFSQTARTICER